MEKKESDFWEKITRQKQKHDTFFGAVSQYNAFTPHITASQTSEATVITTEAQSGDATCSDLL